MELKGGVDHAFLEWVCGQAGDRSLRRQEEKGIHSFDSEILEVRLVCLALYWALEIQQ